MWRIYTLDDDAKSSHAQKLQSYIFLRLYPVIPVVFFDEAEIGNPVGVVPYVRLSLGLYSFGVRSAFEMMFLASTP